MNNTFNSFISYLMFLILSISCSILNIIFYIYKKKGYSLHNLRKIIFVNFIVSTIFLVTGLPFFILSNGDEITESFEVFILPIILFNLSMFLFVFSIIIFLLPHLDEELNRINLEIPSYHNANKGSIKIGKIMKGKRKKFNFYLSIKDLEKHVFICGATGTGKSNFLQNFLINFTQNYNIPFFLVEFKGEYHFLQKKINDLLILWPGENFSINIFNPENSNPFIHAERIFDILKSGQFLDDNAEFSPQMQKVLVEILAKVCKNKELQSWKGFEYYCKKYLKENLNNIPMLKQTLISIKNRIRRFSEGPLKALFEKNNEYEVKTLFKRNVILDLSSIIRLGGEKEDALFFLNMIFKYLWDQNLTKGAFKYKGIKHITIVEDAQYFAPKDLVKKNKMTTYLEDIALLQRGTGECLIALATRPDISRDILANAGVLLTLKNHIEKDLMCELLNLDLEKKNYLSILEEGQGIIRINSIKEPFLLWVPHIERESLNFSEIKSKNELILRNKEPTEDFFDKEEKKKSFIRVIPLVNYLLNFCKKIGYELRIKIKKVFDQNFPRSLKKKKTALNSDIQNRAQILEIKSDVNISKINQENKKKEILPYSIIEETQGVNYNNFNRIILNYKDLLMKYIKITNLHKTESYDEMIVNSIEFINLILDKISQQIGINYKDLNDFLKRITEMKLENKFILYNEIEILATLLHNNTEASSQFKPDISYSILSIIKKIMEKIKIHCKKNEDNNFSNAYDEFKTNSIKTKSPPSTIKVLKNNTNEYELSLNALTELDDFSKLESYIDELSKKKTNKL